MKQNLYVVAALGIFTLACEAPSATTPDLAPQLARGGVTHHVSVGGADICEATGRPIGCDANFSLTANMKADGSVTGQWQDTFTGGGAGIHVAIDCLNVIGNTATIGGLVIRGTSEGGVDLTGRRALTAVVDNGTSGNDLADQISFSITLPTVTCDVARAEFFPLFNLAHGQVKVR